METERSEVSQMSAMDRFINIFSSPREAFLSIEQKPDWLFPFLVLLAVTLVIQYLTLDIQLSDQIEALRHRNLSEAEFETQRNLLMGPMKYISFVLIPIFVPIIWAILSGVVLLAANIFLKRDEVVEGAYKKIFAMIAWSGLVTLVSGILAAIVIQSKGTLNGAALDLSSLLPTPAIGESKSIFYRLMSKIDPFIFWQMFLWMVGLSVFYKVDLKKAAVPVVVLWVIWVAVSVPAGAMLGNLGM
ncbi:MAG: YIP1 family protein [Calditrichaeota bacterium]|nr:YIP1 family protein [Calditrichota bacterium]MCB0292222.1 YIP1 family protein [Calditrichota bacterium]MCB0314767.1 YIP1 family protein [Calditrichota bacterium]